MRHIQTGAMAVSVAREAKRPGQTPFRLILSAALLMGLAGCHATRQPNTAVFPNNALGSNGDPDIRSLNVAAYVFAHPVHDPARAADGVAALDYMGGQLNTSPRWVSMPGLYRAQMLKSRKTMRAYIGISPTAPSQAVVDTMLSLATAYRSNDAAALQTLLSNPIFDVPPAEVTAHLSDIPLMPDVNSATTHAFQYSSSGG
jgi:hypothetical protein